jgi:hypothetical protein
MKPVAASSGREASKPRFDSPRGLPEVVLPHERLLIPQRQGSAGTDVCGACAPHARRPGCWLRAVGGGDVGRQRGDGQPIGGQYGGHASTYAGNPSLISTARSRRRRRRASRARSSPTRKFVVHDLRSAMQLGDEGAANYTRFAGAGGVPGVSSSFAAAPPTMRRPADRASIRPATREACEAIARNPRPRPRPDRFAQQNPTHRCRRFHNDVIAVGHTRFCHE